MVAVVERPGGPLTAMSRHRFTAMVVSSSPQRRVAMVARLRGLGAREVVEAASAAEARVRGRTEGAHDLCVVDASLPDSPVLPLLQDLRQVGWKRIVVLTGRDDPYAVRAALAAGVRGYVVIPESTGPAGATAVVPRSRQRTGTPDELSAREVEVLQLVSDGRSNKQVGEELGLSALTVKSHLARIARKLGTGDRAEMVALAMRSGLVR